MWGKVKFRVENKAGRSCHDLDISRTVLLTTKTCFSDQFHTQSLIKSIFCKNTDPSGQHLPHSWRAVSAWKKLQGPDCFCRPHLHSTERTAWLKITSVPFYHHQILSTQHIFPPNQQVLPPPSTKNWWLDFAPTPSSANKFSSSSNSIPPWVMGENGNNKGEKAMKWLK